jgi:signal transduction histidine kinase
LVVINLSRKMAVGPLPTFVNGGLLREIELDPERQAILIADDDRRYLWASDPACAYLKLRRDLLLGRRIDDFVRSPTQSMDAQWEGFLQKGELRGRVDLEIASGERRTFDVCATARSAPGQHLSILSRPRRARRTPRPKDQRLDDLLASVAHDLRAPVGTALVHARVAALQLRTLGKLDNALEAFQTIEQQMMSMHALIGRVTRFGPGELAPAVLKPEPVDLEDLVAVAIGRLVAQYPRARELVSVRASGDVRGVWDVAAVSDVLAHLIGNALKFGEDGPVEVTLKGWRSEVEVLVSDDGIGIAPQDQRRIFERFGRAVPHRSYPGLGLGLWIAKRVVMAQHGTINVESSPGHGSIFIVRLPRH